MSQEGLARYPGQAATHTKRNWADAFYQAFDTQWWIEDRAYGKNPFDDVDRDGLLNSEDADPNDPNIPYSNESENRKPVADFGSLPARVKPGVQIGLDGSASFDPDGDTISYQWTVFYPERVTSVYSTKQASFTPITEGSYSIRLVVSDGPLDSFPVTKAIEVSNREYDPDPSELPEQYVLGNGTSGVAGAQGFSRGLSRSENWCVNVGPSKSNGCYNAGEFVGSINLTAHAHGENIEGIELAANRGDPPFLNSLGDNWSASNDYYSLCVTPNDYLQKYKGQHNCTFNEGYLDSEQLRIMYPRDGTYYYGAFGWKSFPEASVFRGVSIYLDYDDDGVENENDWAPKNRDEQYDSDGDGIGDNSDAFPNDPAASVDTDRDGCPDQLSGESTTGLVVDQKPNNKNACIDADDDGWDDITLDAFPDDQSAYLDADMDGCPDTITGESSTGLKLDSAPHDPLLCQDTNENGVEDSLEYTGDLPGRAVPLLGEKYIVQTDAELTECLTVEKIVQLTVPEGEYWSGVRVNVKSDLGDIQTVINDPGMYPYILARIGTWPIHGPEQDYHCGRSNLQVTPQIPKDATAYFASDFLGRMEGPDVVLTWS